MKLITILYESDIDPRTIMIMGGYEYEASTTTYWLCL